MATLIKRPAEAWTYVLVSDRALPIEQQTRFTLRPLTMNERAAAHDDLVRTEIGADGQRAYMRRTRQQALAIAVSHIESIENFPVDASTPWPEDRAERRRYLEQLADDDVQEIGNEIWTRSSPSPNGAEKNSSAPERTFASGGGFPATESSTPAPAATGTQT